MYFESGTDHWLRAYTKIHRPKNLRMGGCSIRPFFAMFCSNFHAFSFFHLFCLKMFKNIISTSVWSVQHPNAGWKIQHSLSPSLPSIFSLYISSFISFFFIPLSLFVSAPTLLTKWLTSLQERNSENLFIFS